MSEHYDVIIVGGRVAGSTLAARLGKFGLSVLLLERDNFPSRPAASSPIIYSPTMKLLDEIGADESAYAYNTPRIHRVIGASHDFAVTIDIPHAHGRDYAYALDRARFDATLWDNALSLPSVEGRQNFNVTDLLLEGDRVVGLTGREGKGAEETFTADIVIGADGRYSLVARKMNARVYDEYAAHPTSLYYAYWSDVLPYDADGATAVAYEGELGYGFLVMDSADGQTLIGFEGQSDLLNPPPGEVASFYLDIVRRHPNIASRIAGAHMVTDVHGIRRIGNLYRQAGGTGWALVGDAYHQHDPLDGQGIYNAVFTAKALAWGIRDWKRGQRTWAEALAWYDETARVKTYGRYKAALAAVRQNIYSPQLPGWALTGLRWVMEDPAMRDLMGKTLTRQLPAEVLELLRPPVMMTAMLRGPLRDLWKRLG